MSLWLAMLPIVFASWCLTGWMRRYAIARCLLDVPNERSSHHVPTPRGGGVAIVLVVLVALPFMSMFGFADWRLTWALLGAGGVVAAVGWLDDHGHVSAHWRLLCHFVAAAWALWLIGGAPAVSLFGNQVEPGWIAHVIALLYVVWVLNLFNFMDGIDGIAGIEATSVCLGGVLIHAAVGPAEVGAVEALLASAVAGFLIWNFPQARIFMGDAGSGFVGVTLAVLSLHAAWLAPQLLWSWLILLGVFVVDATFTLLRRLLRGEPVYQAHRTHAYQLAARKCGAHLPVALSVGAINLVWLLPLALMVAAGWLDGLNALLLAYTPLLLAAVLLRAGSEQFQTSPR